VVTANHVVRNGPSEAKPVKVFLNWLPGESTEAQLGEFYDASLDVAILIIRGAETLHVPAWPFDAVGDANSVKRGDKVHSAGYPQGKGWYSRIQGDDVSRVSRDSIEFETNAITPGYSGGGLFDIRWQLIGMIQKDSALTAEAMPIDRVLETVRNFQYPVQLRITTAVGQSAVAVAVAPAAGKAQTDRSGEASPTASTAILSPAAMRERGDQYSSGRGVAQDQQQARQWYENAAFAGDTAAMSSLSWMYHTGVGGRQDHVQARYWIEKAVMAGKVDETWRVGYLYENGIGGTLDYAKARQWYEKGARAGEVICMQFLGRLYEMGHGVAPDYRLARQWYEKAADAGNLDAMFELAALLSGRCRYGAAKCSAGSPGVTPNYPLARQWYKKAADAGHAQSMCELGTIYEAGEGVAQDFPMARQWYEKAVEAGNSEAMRRLGWMYETARGGPQDYQLARLWYEKAGVAGDGRAMYYLGYLYETGHGGPKDYAQAREWYEKAEKAGDPDAGKRLQQLPK
jgi:TPR repeat protein